MPGISESVWPVLKRTESQPQRIMVLYTEIRLRILTNFQNGRLNIKVAEIRQQEIILL